MIYIVRSTIFSEILEIHLQKYFRTSRYTYHCFLERYTSYRFSDTDKWQPL